VGDETVLGYRAWWGLPALPKLNTDNPDVRGYLLSVAEHWLRFGIDGWRLDVPREIDDAVFWAAFRQRCRAIRPDAYLVGEIWEIAPDWVGADRFDALMDYPLAEAILGYVGGSSLDMAVVGAHQEYRRWLRPLDGEGFAARLVELLGAYDPDVVAAQLNLLGSHDTPRPLTVVGGDRAAMRMATLLQCMLPGAPSIYYGDEVGLTGGNDPANRAGFPWDVARWDHDLRAFTRSVIAVRAAEPAVRHGATLVAGVSGAAIAIERRLDSERLVIVVNPGDDPIEIDVVVEGIDHGRLERIPLSGDVPGAGDAASTVDIAHGVSRLVLPPRVGCLYRVAVGGR
jgi:neopullulanase